MAPSPRPSLLIALLAVLAPFTASADPWSRGTFPIGYPFGIAVASNGETYVACPLSKRVEKYSKYGTHLFGWGVAGSGPGQFDYPIAIALDASGKVYVADVTNNRVEVFNSAGTFITQFGSEGTGPGEFANPHGIAIEPAGDIYVLDTFNNRIQRFEPSGIYLSEWGSQGSGPGQFVSPYGIAIDAAGDVYIADTNNHRIQKFSAAGVFQRQWGTQGTGNGQFTFPSAVAVDGAGNVYVTDTNNHRVQRFTSKGVFVDQWGQQGGSNPWQFQVPQGIAVSRYGDLYVSDTGNSRVSTFRYRTVSEHEALYTVGSPGDGAGQFSWVAGVAVAPNGNVFVADRTTGRIQKFSSLGSWAGEWHNGDPEGDPVYANGVAVDTSGFVYVTDDLLEHVRKYTDTGTLVGEWGSPGSGPGQFNGAWDIAIDKSNNVYVIDANRVQKFTSAGAYVTEWPCAAAAGVGTDLEGSVYVTCYGDNVVRKFAPDGTPVLQWGGTGSGPGQFVNPSDVVADSAGSVYVCDANNRVQQFSPLGGYVTEWGESGTQRRQLGIPTMMATDAAGDVYVGEFTNYRYQKFASPPELLEVADVPGDEGGSVRLTFSRSSAEALDSGSGGFADYSFYRLDPFIYTLVGTVPVGSPTNTIVVSSGGNATDVFTGLREFQVRAYLSIPGSFVPRGICEGYSLDNLAPPAPNPFTAAYAGGGTSLHWGASPAADFSQYRLYRSDAPPVPVEPASLIHASPDTGYADPGLAGRYYAIVAADTSGNVSAPSTLGPQETVSAPGATLAFRLEEILPNPSHGSTPYVRFVLPDATKARLELVNVAGRSVWSREVSGAGPHAVRVGAERRLGAGIYFVRLTRERQSLVRRVAVVD